MRILGIDPGDVRIGIAISDPTGSIARPIKVILHETKEKDAEKILAICQNFNVGTIIVGQSLDEHNQPTYQGRKAARLAATIRNLSNIPVILWDEYGSTKKAQRTQITIGSSKKSRKGHLDEMAATVILQSYLDSLVSPTADTGNGQK